MLLFKKYYNIKYIFHNVKYFIMKNKKNSFYSVKSLKRGISIIEALAEKEPELSVTEISKITNLNISTVHRLLGTLIELDWIEQNLRNHKYRLSLIIFELGSVVVENIEIVKQAMPFMEKLSEKYNEAINLAQLQKDEIVYIHKIESDTTLKLDLKLGSRHPSYCTALGKILLAYLDENELSFYLKRIKLKKYTDNTIIDKKKLLNELRIIRNKGYSFDYEEYIKGVNCIAVPIKDYLNEVCAALSIAIPTARFNLDKVPFIIDDLINSAKKISSYK